MQYRGSDEAGKKRLANDRIKAEMLAGNWDADYPRIRRSIISAVNYLEIHLDWEAEFQHHIKELCQKTNEISGFLGSKLLKISGISGIGSFLSGDLTRVDVLLHKYIIITDGIMVGVSLVGI